MVNAAHIAAEVRTLCLSLQFYRKGEDPVTAAYLKSSQSIVMMPGLEALKF